MKAKIIALANHKGGVGKTTSTANLGAALAARGKRTLLIDLDAQQNLTYIFNSGEVETSVYDALTGAVDGLPVISVKENLFLVPSSIDLGVADLELSGRIARESILKRLLDKVAEEYDYILLDCPPSLGIVTYNALVAAPYLIIPLTAEALPLKGLTMLENVVSEIRQAINPNLRISGIFVTRYNNRNLNNVVADQLAEEYGGILFATRIRENIRLAEAPLARKDIFEYAPDSKGAEDYNNLADELISRI